MSKVLGLLEEGLIAFRFVIVVRSIANSHYVNELKVKFIFPS